LYRDQDLRLMNAVLHTSLGDKFYLDQDRLKQLTDLPSLAPARISEFRLAFMSPHFALVPSTLAPSSRNKWAASFTGLYNDPDYEMDIQPLAGGDILLYFMYPGTFRKVFAKTYDQFRLCHLNGALINNHIGRHEDLVLCNFMGKGFQTLMISEGKLLQTNDYQINGRDDALYYTLLNFHQFELDPLNHPCHLSGLIDQESIQFKSFSNHFAKIKLVRNPKRSAYSNVFLGKPRQYFHDLDCVLACGS